MALGAWSDEQHDALQKALEAEVLAAQKEAERHGSLNDGRVAAAATMFDDVYKDMPPHLVEQRRLAAGV